MALSDPVRRSLIARLSLSDATVNELAEPFEISVQAISKHLKVLEKAGLISKSRDAQRRLCPLAEQALETMTSWIDATRLIAERRHRRLDDLLSHLTKEKS